MYDKLVKFCADKDISNSETIYSELMSKNSFTEKTKMQAALQMTELFLKTEDYEKASKTLSDLNVKVAKFKPKYPDVDLGKFKEGASVHLPIIGKVKVTPDEFVVDEAKQRQRNMAIEKYKENYSVFCEHKAYAIALSIIISIHKGDLHRNTYALNDFQSMEKEIDRSQYEFLYARIENAKIIDYLKKSSTLTPFPNDTQLQCELDNNLLMTKEDLYNNLSLSIPSELRYLLMSNNKLLLNAQNVLLLPNVIRVSQDVQKKENVTVGRKVLRALSNTIFDKICENKNISKLIANGSIIGIVSPLFREAGITNLLVISTTLTAVTQFGLDFLCNLKDEIMDE